MQDVQPASCYRATALLAKKYCIAPQSQACRGFINANGALLSPGSLLTLSYYRKLWIRCGNEKGSVPFRVGNANPGGSRVEGDATDVEGSREWSWKGSRRAAF